MWPTTKKRPNLSLQLLLQCNQIARIIWYPPTYTCLVPQSLEHTWKWKGRWTGKIGNRPTWRNRYYNITHALPSPGIHGQRHGKTTHNMASMHRLTDFHCHYNQHHTSKISATRENFLDAYYNAAQGMDTQTISMQNLNQTQTPPTHVMNPPKPTLISCKNTISTRTTVTY